MIDDQQSDNEKKKAILLDKLQKDLERAFLEYKGDLSSIERYARNEVEKHDRQKEGNPLDGLNDGIN